MDSTGSDSFLRNRRFDNFFNTSSEPHVKQPPKIPVKQVEHRPPRTNKECVDSDDDDGGWFCVLISWVRIVTCFVTMMVTTFIWALVMVLLLPWPYKRIRQGNVYGHVTGRLLMWILGNPIKIEGTEFSNERAIYISNHASPIDIFLIMWLTPTGTVGIAKKEIIWYPLFGQLYVLAKHIRIDRSNPSAAIKSMKEAARAVVENKLSLIIFPEGTRSKNGRLLPFKKGFIHLALQSRLPIVPMVLTGTHRAWRNGSLHVRPTPITVKYLPRISTTDWTANKVDDYMTMLRDIYAKNLPEPQKPLVQEGTITGSNS
ncbi:1-acyl-sn-glycerol-3-phosphate acyltransferase-like [Pistacia vera]|uniref:1-acyl-sn-glycerol-3-phosphate acyltransferase-like n=1 Tax=Pistacia vera TaxID=55513 RepID=UPI0012639A2F|nr:1-acyl-sn-glycerol-3-phosphate acyltransferase-like [Pistacia vera]XP_031248061.1 1-acyl-sn-glycerol-3-phosphate acyltransferase-like [Pistacia vera]XP_031248067.1 1-acyl-sn-glycerol-3-phosphate acyltransferase-like [Pistacia vera]